MKTMNRTREWPVVIPSAIIVFVAIALAGLSHVGSTGLFVLIWTGGLGFLLFKFWPGIRTSPRIEHLARYRAKRHGASRHSD
jgi:hypothetical protein